MLARVRVLLQQAVAPVHALPTRHVRRRDHDLHGMRTWHGTERVSERLRRLLRGQVLAVRQVRAVRTAEGRQYRPYHVHESISLPPWERTG
jgi:hypothetical protein